MTDAAAAPRRGVALVIADLGGGGSQRVLSMIANELCASGVPVTVITWVDPAVPFFELAAGVRRVHVVVAPDSGRIAATFRRITGLRRALTTSGAVTAMGFITPTNVLVLLACVGLGLRVVVGERNHPSRQHFPWHWRWLRRLLYRHADLVTANSRGALEDLRQYVPATRLAYLPNPLRVPDNGPAVQGRIVLAVGRLHPQKGHDLLIRAFAASSLARDGDWRLRIIGEGAERGALERLAHDLGVTARVELPGATREIDAEYAAASLFAMPSRYEGTPNALIEAMAAGLAVVASNASPGLGELVDDGVAGVLVGVDDADALRAGLERLAGDAVLRERVGAAARERVAALRIENVLPEWCRALGLDLCVTETP